MARRASVISNSTSRLGKRDVPELSIVVPVFNGAQTLALCLEALRTSTGPSREIIVVDDASQDNSAEIAERLGARIIRHPVNCGCAVARNNGAGQARAQILVFVDSDVVVHRHALAQIYRFMNENKEYSAIIGSYDAKPTAPHFVSQYRNLLHHFTHQTGNSEASTFWTGLGAVRRADFQQVGGFRGEHRPIEDIALGLDLVDGGFRIALDPKILGTHLKRWTLYSTIKTDIFARALPWSMMVLKRGKFTNDLNTSLRQRVGVIATMLFPPLAFMSFASPVFLYASVVLALTAMAPNAQLIKYFVSKRGLMFGIGAIPLHLIHQLCAGVGFGLAAFKYAKAYFIAGKPTQRRASIYGLGPHEG